MDLPTKSVLINGINCAYVEKGKGHPLIFIHGFPFDHTCWLEQLEHFSGSYRTIVYDLRGFGKSESGNAEFSVDLFAKDLIAFMDVLEIKKAAVCGLSMGGYILMNALSKYPMRFSHVILADTQCIADSEEGKEKRYKSIKQVKEEGLGRYSDDFVKAVFCKTTHEKKPELLERVKSVIKKTKVDSVAATLQALANREETCNAMKHIGIPSLVICGKEDAVTPLTQSELLYNTIGKSNLKVLLNAGHLSNLEQPEEFNKALDKFLGENPV